MTLPDMEGWAPEALGAGIGVIGAGLVAVMVTTMQLRAEGARATRHAMRDAFGLLLADVLGLEKQLDIVASKPWEEKRQQIVSQASIWHLYADSKQARVVAEHINIVLTRLLGAMEGERAKGAESGSNPSDRFTLPGHRGRELRDGLFKHGRIWHSSRRGRERRVAEKWFDESSKAFRQAHAMK